MSQRSARIAATTFDDSRGSTSSLYAMEMGDDPGKQQQQRRQIQRDSSEQRVTVAAAEVLEQEGNNREGAARSRQLLAQAVSVVLRGMVAGFGCYFAYVWVDSFRKGRFDESAGVVTVTFVGTVVCAYVCRRRLVPIVRPWDSTVIGQDLQQRPKYPPRARPGFDYFVYPEASSSSGSETSLFSSDEDSGVNAPSAAFESAASFTDIEAPANSNNGVGDESEACTSIAPGFAQESGSKSSSAREDDGAILQPCETKEDENRVGAGKECMVCLEPYKAGVRVCRVPCGHCFHSECIENWLNQNPTCPECRLVVQEEMLQAAVPPPVSTLPDEAFQVSFSSDVVSPPTSTAAAQPPATSPTNSRTGSASGTTPPPSHPDLLPTSRVHSPASAVSTPQAEPPSDPGRASTTTPTTTVPTRVQASTVADSSADMTEINTAINAATAPFAPYFGGSPITEGPASPTFSVVRFVGLSPELGQQGDKPFGTAADTPDPAATPRSSSLRAPFACFDSPSCTQSPPRSNADVPQSSLPASPCAWFLESPDFLPPISPATPQPPPPTDLRRPLYSPGSSDAGEGYFADLTERNTAINATANASDSYALNSAIVAPYAHLFESPTSIIRYVGRSREFDQQDATPRRNAIDDVRGHATSSMVPFRPPGGSESPPFARYLESSPSYYSPSPLSTANMARSPLSPYYPAVPFRRRQQPQQQQQQQQRMGAHFRNGGGDEQMPGHQAHYGAIESTSPPRPSPGGRDDRVSGYQAHYAAIESTSPPRPSPRLVFWPSPAVGRGGPSRGEMHHQPPTPVAQRAPPVHPTSGTASSAFVAEGGHEQGETDCWVWPLSSASIWDNKAWPTIGGRVRIDSLDESTHVCHEGRERNNVRQDQKGAKTAVPPLGGGSGGGRWVWLPDESSERVEV